MFSTVKHLKYGDDIQKGLYGWRQCIYYRTGVNVINSIEMQESM